jgi:hypothetical protein
VLSFACHNIPASDLSLLGGFRFSASVSASVSYSDFTWDFIPEL